MRKHDTLVRIVLAGLLIALGLVLPLFLGQVQILMQGISPMHIPALIAGLTIGPVYGAVVGFVTPLLRMMIFGMPAAPNAIPMAFELCAYGVITGILYPLFVRKLIRNHAASMLLSLLIAMIAGRLVGGAAKAVFMGISGSAYSLKTFVTAYFVGTAVGAVIHLIVCPVVTLALEKVKLSPVGKTLK